MINILKTKDRNCFVRIPNNNIKCILEQRIANKKILIENEYNRSYTDDKTFWKKQ